jgi:hypothetical protein
MGRRDERVAQPAAFFRRKHARHGTALRPGKRWPAGLAR